MTTEVHPLSHCNESEIALTDEVVAQLLIFYNVMHKIPVLGCHLIVCLFLRGGGGRLLFFVIFYRCFIILMYFIPFIVDLCLGFALFSPA